MHLKGMGVCFLPAPSLLTVLHILWGAETCIINKSSPADMRSHGSATALKQVSVA